MSDLQKLIDILHLEQLDCCLFRGQSLDLPLPRVFGGQVLAQALNAAARSVGADRYPHSMHAYFLRPGDPTCQIIYEVDPIRDGGSFSTRRVVAKQKGEAIFICSVSFHKREKGLEHQMDMPEGIIGPDELEPDETRYRAWMAENPDKHKPFFFPTSAVDVRTPEPRNALSPEPVAPVQGFWFKVADGVGDDPVIHLTLLAMISDKRLMSTGLLPHPVSFFSHKLMAASLDHTMWLHGEVRVDQWLYYHMDSPRSAGARDFNRGSFYTQEGVLIASVAQEGLIRVGEKRT